MVAGGGAAVFGDGFAEGGDGFAGAAGYVAVTYRKTCFVFQVKRSERSRSRSNLTCAYSSERWE